MVSRFLHADSKDFVFLIRLHGSESSLGTQIILLLLSCCGSYYGSCTCTQTDSPVHRSSTAPLAGSVMALSRSAGSPFQHKMELRFLTTVNLLSVLHLFTYIF